MPTDRELRAWLEKQRTRWLEEISKGNPFYEYQDVKIIDSILAALSGPTEEERKELCDFLERLLDSKIWSYEGHRKIRRIQFFLGHAAREGEKEEERELEPWVEKELRQAIDGANKFHDEIVGNLVPEKEPKSSAGGEDEKGS